MSKAPFIRDSDGFPVTPTRFQAWRANPWIDQAVRAIEQRKLWPGLPLAAILAALHLGVLVHFGRVSVHNVLGAISTALMVGGVVTNCAVSLAFALWRMPKDRYTRGPLNPYEVYGSLSDLTWRRMNDWAYLLLALGIEALMLYVFAIGAAQSGASN